MPFLLYSALAVFGPMATHGTIIPSLDLPALCDRADLVVVGRAVDVRQAGPTTIVSQGESSPGRLMVVQMDVEKVLKGSVNSRALAFTFSFPATPVVSSGYRAVVPGEFGVFFLRKAEGRYEILDPYYPSVVARPGAVRTGGSLLDQVTNEVASVLASMEEPSDVKEHAIWLLRSVRTPVATVALRAAAGRQPPKVRLAAIGALLARNDVSELGAAEDLLLHPPVEVNQNMLAELAYSIRSGVEDPRAIPNLTRLLRKGDVTVRRAAVSALRNIGGAETVEPLAEALADSDDLVVWTAILGLALATGDVDHGPGAQEEFKGKQKETYVDYWRNWAKSRNEKP